MNSKDSDFYSRSWVGDWSDMKRFSPIGRHTRRMIKNLLSRCGKIDSIMDFGCGDGSLLQEISEQWPQARLFGCDFARESVNQCAARLASAQVAVHDITDPASPFAAVADVGITSEVLEHVQDHETALRNMGNWCRRLIVTVPGGELDGSAEAMGHLRHYTRQSLVLLAEQAGMEVLHVREWGFPFAYPWYARMRNNAGYAAVTGSYGLGKRLLCHTLYALFFLNDLFSSGNKLIMLCRRKED